eukprot:CCRYP_013200-RB/>CCRYP_013200-RB protein AED:0.48 eAED:1.00 QI:0/0/0/1/0/0/3/0/98
MDKLPNLSLGPIRRPLKKSSSFLLDATIPQQPEKSQVLSVLPAGTVILYLLSKLGVSSTWQKLRVQSVTEEPLEWHSPKLTARSSATRTRGDGDHIVS